MCADDVVRLGVELWRGREFFILAEGLQVEFFWHYQVEKAVLCILFVFTLTSPISVHMTQRFVIQGCPTLITKWSKVTDNLLCKVVNSLFCGHISLHNSSSARTI